MAITNVGKNRVYASIKDLPENQSLIDGDRIIVDTSEGTCLVDYANFKIDLAHTTFGEQFAQMVEYSSAVTSFINQIEDEFTTVKEETANLQTKMEDTQNIMDAIKLLIKFIIGSASGKDETFIETQVENNLKGKGLAFYKECVGTMTNLDFSFSLYNLYRSRVGGQ